MKNTLILGILFVAIIAGGYAWKHVPSPGTNITSGAETASMTNIGSGSSSTATYTARDIATHNTSGDCWASIGSNVYDLTSWISKHPGGESRILTICGKDGTRAFEGQHGNDTRAQSALAAFIIGTLSPA